MGPHGVPFILMSYSLLKCPLQCKSGNSIEAIVLTFCGPNKVIAQFHLCTYAQIKIIINSFETV